MQTITTTKPLILALGPALVSTTFALAYFRFTTTRTPPCPSHVRATYVHNFHMYANHLDQSNGISDPSSTRYVISAGPISRSLHFLIRHHNYENFIWFHYNTAPCKRCILILKNVKCVWHFSGISDLLVSAFYIDHHDDAGSAIPLPRVKKECFSFLTTSASPAEMDVFPNCIIQLGKTSLPINHY